MEITLNLGCKECNPYVYLKHCGWWDRLRTNSKKFWIATYCSSEKQALCKRRGYQQNGIKVPENLLPNGTFTEL